MALTQVTQRFADLSDDTGWALVTGFGRTLLLFLALWLIWSHTAWITSRYEPEQPLIQTIVVGTVFAGLVMAVTLPRAMEERALPFTAAYLMVMVVRPLVVAAALRGHPRRLVPFRLAVWASASAPLSLAGALGPDHLRLPLWAAALAVDYHRAGLLLTEAFDRAGMPGRLGAVSERTHLLIVLSVLVTSVGYELVIDQPYGLPRPSWLLFVVGGPVLFLVARMRLEHEIFGRVSRPQMIGLAALLLFTPALARWAPMVGLSVVAGVLALVTLLDVLWSRGRPLEGAASPIGRETSGDRDSEA